MSDQSQLNGSKKVAFISVTLCCLAAVCEGMDLQLPGVSAPILSSVFNMSPDQTGFFLSMSTFGMMIGAVLGGRLSDVIGRKWMLIASISTYSVFTVLTTISSSADMLFWLRFLTGIGLGGALPNLVSLAVESVSKERRSTAVGLMLAGPGIGGAIASLVAAVTATPDQWQILYYVGGLGPLLIVVPLLIFFLPNRRPDSTEINDSQKDQPHNMVSMLFGEGRAIKTLAVWTGLFSILLVLFVVLSWLPTLLVDRGLTTPQASLVQMVVNLSAIPGSLLAGMALDYILKRRMMLALVGVFVAAIAAIVFLAGGPANVNTMLIAGGLAGLTIIGCQTMIYALAPICYPESIRGTGVGFGVAVGRFGSAGGPIITGYLVTFGFTSASILLSLIPVTVLAGGAALYIAKSVDIQNNH